MTLDEVQTIGAACVDKLQHAGDQRGVVHAGDRRVVVQAEVFEIVTSLIGEGAQFLLIRCRNVFLIGGGDGLLAENKTKAVHVHRG